MNDETSTPKTRTKWNISNGGKNLIWLGVISIFIAAITTVISVMIYHNSGDIYLDRSRPGFLPEEGDESNENQPPEEYEFTKTGKLTPNDIEEYLEKLEADIKAIDSYSNPFSADILSDKNLGIENK